MTQKAFEAFKLHQRADDELLSAAHEASEAVEAEELLYLDFERVLREARSRVDVIEARTAAAINRERDDEAKKPGARPALKFSNDAQRKSELALRLGNDSSYRDAVRGLAEAETEQRVRRIKIEKLLRTYSLAKLSFEALCLGRREPRT
jgi:hypothetical protein